MQTGILEVDGKMGENCDSCSVMYSLEIRNAKELHDFEFGVQRQ
jgi:hypothetical protein